MGLERDVTQLGVGREPGNRERYLVRGGTAGAREEIVDAPPDHVLDQACMGMVADRPGRNMSAVAEDGHAVGDCEDLVELVGDVEDRNPKGGQAPDDGEEKRDLVRRERRGRLVHDHDPRLMGEGAGDLDHLLLADRKAAGLGGRIDGEADPLEQRPGIAADRLPIDRAGAAGRVLLEEDVLRHGELGDQRDLLEDDLDPLPDGVAGMVDLGLASADADRAGVFWVDAGKDLDQRRLAGAVLAHESVHLARLEAKIDAVERHHARETLADPGHLQGERRALGDRRHSFSRHHCASARGRAKWQ